MCCDWGPSMSLGCSDTSLQFNNIILVKKFVSIRYITSGTTLIHSCSHFFFNFCNSFLERFCYSMSLQRFNIETCIVCWENDECYDCNITTTSFQIMIQSRQRFNKDISSFVSKLIPSSNEEEKCFFKVEVNVSIKMSIHKLFDLFLVHLM